MGRNESKQTNKSRRGFRKGELTTLTLYLIETPFDFLANRADPDQAALVRAV